MIQMTTLKTNKSILTLLIILTFGCKPFYGQCWQKIASKYDHVLAIHIDGTLWNWGSGKITKPTLLDSSTNWVDISTGRQFNAAIKADGTLWTWGDNSYGQLGDGTTTNHWTPTKLGTDTNWKQVSCGEEYMIAIKTNGTLWAWGHNNYGQLGNGNFVNSKIPIKLGTDTTWIEISAGKYQSLAKKLNTSLCLFVPCFNNQDRHLLQVGNSIDWKTMSAGPYTDYGIKQNGTLWTWNNLNGHNTTPTQVGTNTDWKKVNNSQSYSTEDHALLIKMNGTLWAIGENQFGQLGDGTLTGRTLPVQIGTANDWKDVTAGNCTSFAIKNNNALWAWGRNNHAQFGNGKNENTPTAINTSTTWKTACSSTASFSGHTLAIQSNGTLWAWGQNNDGQLGNGTTYTHKALPIQVGTDTTWKTITNGFGFSIGIKTDGSLWAWGRNSRGQLGTGLGSSSTPVKVGNDSNWLMVSAGGEFVIALKNNGTLWAWGYNYDGQLGNGNTNDASTPIQIGTDSNWVLVSAGYQHSLALKSDSTLWTWGSNSNGQLGRSGNQRIPMQVGNHEWKSIGAGGSHSLGIKSDSTLWTWGNNLYAQLGDNTTSSRSYPVQISTEHTWKNIAGGQEHSLATKIDSSLWAWGRNASGQVGDTSSFLQSLSKTYVPTKITSMNNWKNIDGGCVNSIGITTAGTLYTWGDSYISEYQMHFPQLGYVYWTPLEIKNCSYCQATSYTINDSICNGSAYLLNGTSYTSAGTYMDTITNMGGCDSVITLNLTIKNVNTNVTQNGATFTSNANAAVYQWIDCNNNNQPISGQTAQSYTATNNGNYAVIVTKNGCTDTSSCYQLIGLSISENSDNQSIFVYPNPSSNGKFTIENTEAIKQITITDITGKVLVQQATNQQKTEIDLSSFSKGIYFLNATLKNNEIKSIKIISH